MYQGWSTALMDWLVRGGDRGRISGEWRRRRFLALLGDPDDDTIGTGHQGRFARFGVEYVEAGPLKGRRLSVMDRSEVDDDLVGDVTEILTIPILCCSVRPPRERPGPSPPPWRPMKLNQVGA